MLIFPRKPSIYRWVFLPTNAGNTCAILIDDVIALSPIQKLFICVQVSRYCFYVDLFLTRLGLIMEMLNIRKLFTKCLMNWFSTRSCAIYMAPAGPILSSPRSSVWIRYDSCVKYKKNDITNCTDWLFHNYMLVEYIWHFKGVGSIFRFNSIFDEKAVSKQCRPWSNSPDVTSDLGLHCLPMALLRVAK